jgi:hypothetical protein
MRNGSLSLGALGLVFSLISGCAAGPAPTAAAPSAAATPAEAAEVAKFDPDQVVCRVYDSTGSRVRKEKICKTRAEWNEAAERAQQWMRDIERQGSTQPGGETLRPGG